MNHLNTQGGALSLLRIAGVQARTGLGRSAIYKLIKAGKFPPPRRVAGTRASVWSSADVEQFVREQLAATEPQEV